jgi:signal transduction histidine kinase
MGIAGTREVGQMADVVSAARPTRRERTWRWLPAAILVVLLVAAIGVFVTVRQAVDDQNGRILRERTGEIGLLLKSAVGNIPATMSGLGVASRLGSDPAQAFLREAHIQPGLNPTQTVALVHRSGGRLVVQAVAGVPTLGTGDVLTGSRAGAVDRALAGRTASTSVLGRGRTRVIGFAVGPPTTAPNTAIYLQAPVDPAAAAHSPVTHARPFDELSVVLYASPRPEPSQLVLATAPTPLHGQVVRQTIAVGGRSWLLAAAAAGPLVGTFANAVPWVILGVGVVIAIISAGVLLLFQRRRDYALAVVDVRTRELAQSMAELEETQEKLVFQERLAAIGQMAAAVGHELRNPLAVLTNTLYLLRAGFSGVEAERLGRHVDRAEREVGAAVVIVESLLEFARAREPLDENVDLGDLVDEALSVAPPPEAVEVVREGLDAAVVRADHQQLRQVLLNLVTNAYQAMDGDGVLSVGARATPDGGLELTVSDTGSGMDAETAAQVFDAFFTRKAKGIGLGLAVTKRIVDAHGAAIAVDSAVGIGTTFALTFPPARVAEAVPT